MSKPWGIGAWAAEAEREEAEEKEKAAAAAAASIEAFPTLGESVSMKPKKKKQQQTFSLSELTIGRPIGPGSGSRYISDSRGLTTEEMMMLPTGPRDRSGEEEQRGGLGGAFRDYRDYNRVDREQNRDKGFERDREGSGFLRDRERDEPSRADDSSDWSSSKKHTFPSGFDGGRRQSRFSERDPPPPLRADEAANWGLVKRSLPLATDARTTGRRELFDESKQHSRADEADNWTLSKKPLPPPLPRAMASSGQDAHSRADEADNWSSFKKALPMETKHDLQIQDMNADFEGHWGRRNNLQHFEGTGETHRRRHVIAPRSLQSSPSHQSGLGVESQDASDGAIASIPKIKLNPFGSARPREEVLSERGHDLPSIKDEPSKREQDSRPSSSHSSRPELSETTEEPISQAKPRVNPFGNAKPREVLLQERGKDWRKMDLDYEHRGVDRPETEEEISLKQEIKRLTELSKQDKEASAQQMNGVTPDSEAILEELCAKEKQLETLTRTLDDRVRFSQKVGDRPRPGSHPGSRPGSQSGRSDAGDLIERPGSQSGRRNLDTSESPRSQSGYVGGRTMEWGDRWSRGGQFEGTRNQEGLERMGSWAGSSESGRSFDSLQRPWRRSGTLPTEVGGAPEFPQEAAGPDVWTRYEPRRNRQGSWGERDRGNIRGGTRRF